MRKIKRKVVPSLLTQSLNEHCSCKQAADWAALASMWMRPRCPHEDLSAFSLSVAHIFIYVILGTVALWQCESNLVPPPSESQLNHYLTFPFVSKLSHPSSLRMERPRLCSLSACVFGCIQISLCLYVRICFNFHLRISLCFLSAHGFVKEKACVCVCLCVCVFVIFTAPTNPISPTQLKLWIKHVFSCLSLCVYASYKFTVLHSQYFKSLSQLTYAFPWLLKVACVSLNTLSTHPHSVRCVWKFVTLSLSFIL